MPSLEGNGTSASIYCGLLLKPLKCPTPLEDDIESTGWLEYEDPKGEGEAAILRAKGVIGLRINVTGPYFM